MQLIAGYLPLCNVPNTKVSLGMRILQSEELRWQFQSPMKGFTGHDCVTESRYELVPAVMRCISWKKNLRFSGSTPG